MAAKAWSTTAASNINSLTGIGLGADENQAPSLVNDAMRSIMAQLAAVIADIYSGLGWYYAGTGTNTITITPNPAQTAYASGQSYAIKAAATNTGATTLNINGLGAKAIQYQGTALKGGELVSGKMFFVIYDGTQFELMNPFVYAAQDTTNKHLAMGSGAMAAGFGAATEPNVAYGQGALAALTTGYGHLAVGVDAGKLIQGAQGNTAIGHFALDANVSGNQCTAVGNSALGNSTGDTNSGFGRSAGLTITTGSYNVCLGYAADSAAAGSTSSVAVGAGAVAATEGIAIGRGAVAGANKLALGSATYALTTQSTIGANGAASALTANPLGYLVVNINGTERIMPFYTK